METKREEIEQQVKEFLSEQCGVDIKHLAGFIRLEHDLGITGDDAEEMMEAFRQRFEVDMSQFDFKRYFGPETGCNPAVWLLCRIFWPRILHSEPITIGDLVEVAMQQKWVAKQPAAISSRQ